MDGALILREKIAAAVPDGAKLLFVRKGVLAIGRSRWVALAASLVVSAAIIYAQGTKPIYAQSTKPPCCADSPAPAAPPSVPIAAAAPGPTAAPPAGPAPQIASPAEVEKLAAGAPAAAQQFLFPLSPGVASEQRLQVKTIWAARAISVLFPEITTIYGYREDPLPWHPNGLAIDVMIPNRQQSGRHPARQRNRRVRVGECEAVGNQPRDLAPEDLPGCRLAELDGQLRQRNAQPLRPRSYRHQRRRISDRSRDVLHRVDDPRAVRVINARR